MGKKLISWMVIAFVTIGTILPGNICSVNAATVSDSGINNNMANAVNFSIGDKIEGNLSVEDSADFYRFTLTKEGRVDLKYFTEIEGCSSQIYNEDGEKIWESGDYLLNWNEVTHSLTYKASVHLRVGTYYIVISKYNDYTGSYNITTNFVDAHSNVTEPNDSFATAKMIKLNSEINGIIDEEEETDIFKFSLSTSCDLKLKMNTDSLNSVFTVYIYDTDGNQIWDDGDTFKNWNQSLTATKYLSLNKGTYYLALHEYNYYSSMYSFTLNTIKKVQTISMINSSKTFLQKDLRKNAKSFAIGAKAKGKITYKVTSGSKYVSVSKSGKVTIKKNTPKGKYKIKIYANATSNYKATSKTIKIVVK